MAPDQEPGEFERYVQQHRSDGRRRMTWPAWRDTMTTFRTRPVARLGLWFFALVILFTSGREVEVPLSLPLFLLAAGAWLYLEYARSRDPMRALACMLIGGGPYIMLFTMLWARTSASLNARVALEVISAGGRYRYDEPTVWPGMLFGFAMIALGIVILAIRRPMP